MRVKEGCERESDPLPDRSLHSIADTGLLLAAFFSLGYWLLLNPLLSGLLA